jgi:hypothetical protein
MNGREYGTQQRKWTTADEFIITVGRHSTKHSVIF